MKTILTRRLTFDGDAFGLFQRIKQRPHAFFLDSSLCGAGARFSYLGFDPFKVIDGRSLAALQKAWSAYRLPQAGMAFPAGAVGYLGYDGQIWFGLYDGVAAIDHKAGAVILSALSKKRLDILEEALRVDRPLCVQTPFKGRLLFKSNFTKPQYVAAVSRALAHIKRGDIYQINLSQRIDVAIKHWQDYADAALIYGQLRRTSPSPFGAYLDDGKQYILSASPERFLQLRAGLVQVRPMKGTRPRGKDRVGDERLRQELISSAKEIAELLMVTDLERNDLGRVCDYGSVKVKAMRNIEEYATVFQATSTVEGRLHKQFDQFDLLKSVFPSGSVTGCPKIAAMRIISDLEKGSRGLYTGALGYISFTGDMDFNVLIRTLFLKKDSISFHVGGGIVADSNPQAEWEETWVKAYAMQEALRRVFEA